MTPTFSIIIPTYNRADRIAETIQSVLHQTYDNFELIIVDDGSTDTTQEIVSSIADARIRYFKKENEERAIARNFGIIKSIGEYITFLDSDDMLYPYYFEESLKVIKSNNNPEWLHLAYEIKDEKGKVLRRENKRKGDINKSLITGNHLSCIGVFVRNDIIQKHRFNEDPDIIGSEDYLLWMKLASNYSLRYSNRISAYMIQHTERSVDNFNAETLLKRVNKSIDYIIQDHEFQNIFMKSRNRFIANRFFYLALHLLLIKEHKLAMQWFWNGIKSYPPILFTRKSLAFIKLLP